MLEEWKSEVYCSYNGFGVSGECSGVAKKLSNISNALTDHLVYA